MHTALSTQVLSNLPLKEELMASAMESFVTVHKYYNWHPVARPWYVPELGAMHLHLAIT